ncbi:MAG: UxaA family hydrolase [Verrucomicrobiae bacterium]|nr:UxaA family hydrolase [Verrucomicrobiae bacterium]
MTSSLEDTHPDVDPRLIRLDPRDNVLCVARPLAAGDSVLMAGRPVRIGEQLPHGAKLASQAIAAGAPVRKYGQPIGVATRDIAPGELVHVHNLRSDYLPTYLHTTQDDYFRHPAAPAAGGAPQP